MDAAFTPFICYPLKMLDDIRNINLVPIDACLDERAIEKHTRGTYERPASKIFSVSGLLTNKHHSRRRLSFTEYGLSAGLP